MEASTTYYRDLLRAELARRTRRNPRYSLRAFAGSLDIDAAALSRVIAGKRALSLKTARRLVERLGCTAKGRKMFLDSVANHLKSRQLDRVAPELGPAERAVSHLGSDRFVPIADWQHYAILELTYTEGFRDDPAWIAAKLGIEVETVRSSLDRLLKAGLLIQDGAHLRKVERAVHVGGAGAKSDAVRGHQRQLQQKALAALDQVPPEVRAVTTLVLPTDPQLLPVARQMIEDFAWQLCRHLTEGRMTEVYALSVSLFPLQGGPPR